MLLNILQYTEQPRLSGPSVSAAEVGRSWHRCSSEARGAAVVCV